MRDFINIGSTPSEEDCAQVGSDGYYEKATEECHRYLKCLRQHFGLEPVGAKLGIKGFDHDFGTYYEVVCYFDTEDREAIDYAFRVESGAPGRWSDYE